MRRKIACFLSLIWILVSCSSILTKEQEVQLKSYEKNIYVMKESRNVEGIALPKGMRIKIYIVTSNDFIKVYCYPEKEDFLKAKRALILYLFEDDFAKKTFNKENFETSLFKIISVAK